MISFSMHFIYGKENLFKEKKKGALINSGYKENAEKCLSIIAALSCGAVTAGE